MKLPRGASPPWSWYASFIPNFTDCCSKQRYRVIGKTVISPGHFLWQMVGFLPSCLWLKFNVQLITLENLLVFLGLKFLYVYKVLKKMNALAYKCVEFDRHAHREI